MQIAETAKLRSKDPNTQTGAVLVSPDNRVLSLGYNGAPNGFLDEHFPWAREADDALDTKYTYVIHADALDAWGCARFEVGSELRPTFCILSVTGTGET